MEPWPSLKDPEFIDFMQQYPSQLCKRTHMVLRKFAHGFIACKYSALSYLIIGILWLDRKNLTRQQIINRLTHFDIRKNGAFKSRQLEGIFMTNQRVEPTAEVEEFQHGIRFEDNIALFGIVDSTGNIFHYFLLVKLPDGYSILSSYGGDSVSMYQYETKVTLPFFINFSKSLKKATKTTTDKQRIRGFMRAHFLNPVFKMVERKSEEYIKETVPEGSPQSMYMKNEPTDISDEIERYVRNESQVIHFQSILPAIVDELSSYESTEPEPPKPPKPETPEAAEPETPEAELDYLTAAKQAEEDAETEEAAETKRVAEEVKGGMRQRRTRKGKRTHYVRSRRMSRRTLHKK